MNKLLNVLRGLGKREPQTEAAQPAEALPGFDNRLEALQKFAEQAAAYEDDLNKHLAEAESNMTRLTHAVNLMIDAGRDQDAFEYLRLAARLRPQVDLLSQEIRAFQGVATALQNKVNLLFDNLDQARQFARDGSLNPRATEVLDRALNQLTRLFVLLDRVAQARRRELPDRLAEAMTQVIDNVALDMELARWVMARRRALGSGN
ncbi:MAG: hypothetical protein OHK0023_24800 [Anaerolineae bacterium]